MVNDALSGCIDLIITKSVSRFARNTVDSLTTIRQLKEKGVEVYFEKENLYTE
jgi:DNA invertase Pin-like site-specific DNA recombinase